MSMNSINERIDFIIKIKVGGRSKFAEILKVSPQYVNKIATPGGSVGLEPVLNILRLFPDIDARWLLLGEGSPFSLSDRAGEIKRSIGDRIDFLFSIEKYIAVMDPEDLAGLDELIRSGSFESISGEKLAEWDKRLAIREESLNERVQKAMEVGVCKTKSDNQ